MAKSVSLKIHSFLCSGGWRGILRLQLFIFEIIQCFYGVAIGTPAVDYFPQYRGIGCRGGVQQGNFARMCAGKDRLYCFFVGGLRVI